jgi:O-antigen ligase
VPQGNYSRIIAVALLLGWLIQGFGRWQFGKATGIVAALLAYWFWASLSAGLAADQAVAWKYVEELTKVVLPFIVGITTINSVPRLKLLAWVIVLSHGYVAFEMNLSYLQGFNRIQEVGFAGLDNNCFAIAMVASTGMAFFLGLHAEKWWLKGAAMLSGLLAAHSVLLSFSRGGMIALIFTAVVTFWLIPKRPIYYVAFAIALAVGFRLAGPEVRERFKSSFAQQQERDYSAESRLQLWTDCCDVMAKNPLVGVGPANWPLIAPRYGWPLGKEAHTLWLQLGAELGIPGLFFLVMFYGLTVIRLWPLARESGPVLDPTLRYLSQAVIASICGFAVAAQFVSLSGLEAPYYITLVGAGVLKLASFPPADVRLAAQTAQAAWGKSQYEAYAPTTV